MQINDCVHDLIDMFDIFIPACFSIVQAQRNLSQLPNFAFSLPLALFSDAQDEKGFDDGVVVPCSEADNKVRECSADLLVGSLVFTVCISVEAGLQQLMRFTLRDFLCGILLIHICVYA